MVCVCVSLINRLLSQFRCHVDWLLLDSDMTMKSQVLQLICSCVGVLRQLRSIRRSLYLARRLRRWSLNSLVLSKAGRMTNTMSLSPV